MDVMPPAGPGPRRDGCVLLVVSRDVLGSMGGTANAHAAGG
jgi:hypothetical protein